jgi:hypothetical protein
MNIKNLEKKYKTDKFDLGYFDHIYQYILPKYIQSAKNILEIGVFNGESLLLWQELFINANIYGADINLCQGIDNNDRITNLVGDAYNNSFCNQFKDNYFDIIIDDGPHTIESFKFLIDNYLHKINSGGLLVIEDIIDTNWTRILIDKLTQIPNITYKIYNMCGKQKTENLLQKWKNGLDVISINKL